MLRSWQALRFPNSLLAAVAACKNGVRRAHLVDARADGGLLLELYSRDGTGTMISTDFYECALLFVVFCLRVRLAVCRFLFAVWHPGPWQELTNSTHNCAGAFGQRPQTT